MDIQEIQKLKEQKEVIDFINAYSKLIKQRQNPSRDGMIDALKDSLKVGQTEIRNDELSRGETTPTPWEQISDQLLLLRTETACVSCAHQVVLRNGDIVLNDLIYQRLRLCLAILRNGCLAYVLPTFIQDDIFSGFG